MTPNASVSLTKDALGNRKVRKLLLELWQLYRSGDAIKQQQVHQEYVEARRFLISTPYTTTTELRQKFWRMKHISVDTIGDMYDSVRSDSGPYWHCENCGPLIERNGRLYGLKSSVCSNHSKGAKNVSQVQTASDLRVIKRGIHLRTLIPGKPELALFKQISQVHDAHPDELLRVTLWPGIDRYDIQLQFRDEVWAIDIKDYKDPYQLGRKLTAIYGAGELRYNRGFYVFPNYRLKQRENYQQIATNAMSDVPRNISLMSDSDLCNQVEAKVSQLRRES